MKTTKHAQVRAQQRRIPDVVIDMLERFGAVAYQRQARIRYFDKKAWRHALHYTGGQLADSGWSNAYLITGTDGQVVTVGSRYKRMKGK